MGKYYVIAYDESGKFVRKIDSPEGATFDMKFFETILEDKISDDRNIRQINSAFVILCILFLFTNNFFESYIAF